MTKAQALYLFWRGFGLPAIEENSAYDEEAMRQQGIDFPYISYEIQSSHLGEPIAMTASLWYKTTTLTNIEAKAQEIADRIGYGGKKIKIDGGYMKIMLPQDSTTYQNMEAEVDNVRRVVFNILVDYMTAT